MTIPIHGAGLRPGPLSPHQGNAGKLPALPRRLAARIRTRARTLPQILAMVDKFMAGRWA